MLTLGQGSRRPMHRRDTLFDEIMARACPRIIINQIFGTCSDIHRHSLLHGEKRIWSHVFDRQHSSTYNQCRHATSNRRAAGIRASGFLHNTAAGCKADDASRQGETHLERSGLCFFASEGVGACYRAWPRVRKRRTRAQMCTAVFKMLHSGHRAVGTDRRRRGYGLPELGRARRGLRHRLCCADQRQTGYDRGTCHARLTVERFSPRRAQK